MIYTVYSKPNCPFCDQAKALLTQASLPYTELILDMDQPKLEGVQYISREALIAKFPDARTVPQIVFTRNSVEQHIGGFLDLKQSLLKAA